MLLVPALAAMWVWHTRWPPVQAYRLYLSERRQDAVLPWSELTESWTEAGLKQRLAGYPMQCGPDHTGTPKATRACTVDLNSFNGVPAMHVNFIFAADKLQRVATATPWWRHGAGLSALIDTYGPPQVSQAHPLHGVRLHGWKLKGGGYLFYNRDQGFNPLEPSSTQWFNRDACAPSACIP